MMPGFEKSCYDWEQARVVTGTCYHRMFSWDCDFKQTCFELFQKVMSETLIEIGNLFQSLAQLQKNHVCQY